MKEFFQITCMALLLFLAGCKNETPGYNGGGDDPTPDDTEMGYLVTSGLTVSVADDEVISTPELTIPHPGIAEREFVLTPLCEVLRQRPHPVLGLTMGELRDNLLGKTK